ncbi:D-glycero-beta-D-manno-heptose 1,7-bisphosphate 7-phosphatase [Gammaproteobacteria bacterium]|nr:D-glycero-beta-D-manno-heptose 1,7-bisphosphate 7-phosphatase [Gammaproteobacteria bacterium]
MTSNLIILDRDGVINYDSDDYIKNAEEWIPLPGSIEAISELSRAGFKICVATNQSGLGRGLFTEYDLSNMHELMRLVVEEQGGKIDGIFFCPHTPDDKCSCRKPGVELLNQIEQQFSQSVENSWFIGDTEKDIDAALAKHCKPILVLTGKGSLTQATIKPEKLINIPVFDDLFSATMFVISELNSTS